LVAAAGIPALIFFWNVGFFPSFALDEGVHITDALTFKRTGQLVKDTAIPYGHPFMGWAILGLFFYIVGFPERFHGGTLEARDVPCMYLVPRIAMSLLATTNAFLACLIARRHHGNRWVGPIAAIMSSLSIYSFYFRAVFLDSIMSTLVLAAILAVGSKKERLIASGALLGAAVLTKLPAIFFLPPLIFQVWKGDEKNFRSRLVAFLLPLAAIVCVWPSYALLHDELHLLVSAQLWQAFGRLKVGLFSPVPSAMITVLQRDVVILLGLIGSVHCFVQKSYVEPLSVGTFISSFFILNLSFADYYIFPLVPILSVAAARLVRDLGGVFQKTLTALSRKTPWHVSWRLPNFLPWVLLTILSVGPVRLIVSDDSARSQIAAVSYIVENAQKGSTVVCNPVYSWVIKERRDLAVYQFVNVPANVLNVSDRIYLVVDIEYLSSMDVRSGFPASSTLFQLYQVSEPGPTFSSSWRFIEVRVVHVHRTPQLGESFYENKSLQQLGYKVV